MVDSVLTHPLFSFERMQSNERTLRFIILTFLFLLIQLKHEKKSIDAI